MPPRKESPEEKSACLLREGHRLRVKSDYIKICTVLKDREDLMAKFKRELVGLGELTVEGDLLKEGAIKSPPAAVKEEDPK